MIDRLIEESDNYEGYKVASDFIPYGTRNPWAVLEKNGDLEDVRKTFLKDASLKYHGICIMK